MACTIDLIRTSFAAMDMFFLAQFEHLFTSLCFIDLNLSLLILPSCIDSPRYFSSTVVFGTWTISNTLALFRSEHPVPKRMEHFDGFKTMIEEVYD
jgi:hypothetical protein